MVIPIPRRIIITGSMISPEATPLLNDNQLETIVLPGIPDSDEIAAAIRQHQAVGLIVRTGKIDEQVLSASSSLRVVVKHGVGIDNIDLEAASQHGVAVMIAHGANTRSVAEHALALMLSVAKQLNSLDQGLRAGELGQVQASRYRADWKVNRTHRIWSNSSSSHKVACAVRNEHQRVRSPDTGRCFRTPNCLLR